jgi:hypothetical protein
MNPAKLNAALWKPEDPLIASKGVLPVRSATKAIKPLPCAHMVMISGSTFDFDTAGFNRVSRSNFAVETV